MTYRDEREALHNQVAALEEDLAEARREAASRDEGALREKAAALEAQVGTMRSELARMEAELAELRGPTPAKRPAGALPRVLVMVGTAVVGGVAAFALTRAPARQTAPMQPPPAPSDPGPDLMDRMRQSAKTPVPAPSAKASAEVVAPDPPRTTDAHWTAKVKRAEGGAVAAGATCTIDATIAAHGVNAVVDELVVTCGGKKLYAKSDPLNGMAMTGNDARERLGPTDDKSRFTLQYDDKGTRSGSKSQIELDSNQGLGVVFSENLPSFKVELAIPVESEPTAPLNGKGHRLSRTGVVERASGAATVKAGDACTVRALPTGQQQSCVAEVKCGAKVLVATTAPVSCTYQGARIETVSGTGSPSLAIADDGAEVSVPGDHGYAVRITFGKD